MSIFLGKILKKRLMNDMLRGIGYIKSENFSKIKPLTIQESLLLN